VFLNLLRTDVLDNPTYAHKVVFAPFYQGVGTSCDRYGGVHDTGLRVGEDGLVSGNPTGDVYELFVH
jgi:hypothetical protein